MQDTPSSMMVIRFTQDGIPVNSLDEPDVVATAVPSVNGWDCISGVTLVNDNHRP